MTLLQSIILGIVEGVTEFLPISSTGHLILASRLLGLTQTDFQKSFEIAIQLGAIASVVLLYWRRFLEPNVLSKVLVAFVPTGLIGFALYRLVKTYLFDSDTVVLWALGLGGVVLIVFELLHREPDDAVDDVASISYSKAFLIGLFQSLSIVPGVSRAGATIVGGLILGLTRTTIVQFSFLLAVPTMAMTYSKMLPPSRLSSSVSSLLVSSLLLSSRSLVSSSCLLLLEPTPSYLLVSTAS
jgi:undecaprenyl-diphosphatase